jgi:hypothetical protein
VVAPPLGIDLCQAHIRNMPFPVTTIAFETVPAEAKGWRVAAAFPDGRIEHITGFLNEGEARDWIGSQGCLEWAKTKGHQ